MHRLFTRLLPFLLLTAGCAAAGHSNGFNTDDMGMSSFPDLAGLDLLGVDLTGFPSPGDMSHAPCDVLAQTNCGTNEKCTIGAPDMGNECISNGDKLIGQLCG